mmetsp:Transcript_20919/g.30942  ORF Transcript_20919/g.30942 Transcript_20919/m.30942 type:complete len:113 (+) Transcript_20919:968-1306(+)
MTPLVPTRRQGLMSRVSIPFLSLEFGLLLCDKCSLRSFINGLFWEYTSGGHVRRLWSLSSWTSTAVDMDVRNVIHPRGVSGLTLWDSSLMEDLRRSKSRDFDTWFEIFRRDD